jgi:hypothetical protein
MYVGAMGASMMMTKPDLLFFDYGDDVSVEATNWRARAFLEAFGVAISDEPGHAVEFGVKDMVEELILKPHHLGLLKRQASQAGLSLDNGARDWPYPYGERPPESPGVED